ncbi:MAG: hypothetical protein ACOZIN_01225 [Myxococcota bacterium]
MLRAQYNVWIVVLVAAAAWAQEPPGKVLDRVVAIIDGRALTLSEVEFEGRVTLISAGGVEAATALLDDAALKEALDHAIGVRLQSSEADKLQAYTLEPGEIEAAIALFQRRFSSPRHFQQFLDRHDADLQHLATVLARNLRAAKILDAKLKLRAQVSEAEVRRYYDEHAAELGSSYEEVRGPLKDKLVIERLRKLTLAELAAVRRGADVRIIAPFARKESASSP